MGDSYEVYIDVVHHHKHDDGEGRKLSRCWRYANTGDPEQMVANALREFAAELRPEEGDMRSDFSIFEALDKIRADHVMDKLHRRTVILTLDRVATELGLEWYGVRS
jgi:hypothetical protein